MKKLLLSSVGVPLLAIFAMGCADSGQGGAADNESGVVTSPAPLIDPSEPGVASEPGTTPTTSTNYVHETPARSRPTQQQLPSLPRRLHLLLTQILVRNRLNPT